MDKSDQLNGRSTIISRMISDQSARWATTARVQCGVVTRAQLLELGISSDQTKSLLRRGILERRADGVYQATSAESSYESRLWVAVLATRGWLRSSTAVHHWGMIERPRGPIRIAIPRRRHLTQLPGVQTYRRDLPPGSILLHSNLPIMSRREALLDHLGEQPVKVGLTLIDRALQQRWLTEDDLRTRLSRPFKGNTRLRELVAALMPGAEAESERILHRLLRQAGIGGWIPNLPVPIGPGRVARVDVAFAGLKIAIELDGFAHHSNGTDFQADRTRQNELVLVGWTVLRFTWADLRDRPEHVIAVIQLALAGRSQHVA